jgi:hypothetical protein
MDPMIHQEHRGGLGSILLLNSGSEMRIVVLYLKVYLIKLAYYYAELIVEGLQTDAFDLPATTACWIG